MAWLSLERGGIPLLTPNIELTSGTGEAVSLLDFRDRFNLVIVIFPASLNGEIDQSMAVLSRYMRRFSETDTQVLIIESGSGLEPVATMQAQFPKSQRLIDSEGTARERYRQFLPVLRARDYLVLVVDRYGEIYAAYTGQPPVTEPVLEEVRRWLDFIDLQCPE